MIEHVPSWRFVLRALPYIGVLTAVAALATASLSLDNGNGGNQAVPIAAVTAAITATLTMLVAPERRFWRSAAVTAVAVGLIVVSGMNPGAMLATKSAAFAAAAGAYDRGCPALSWRGC